MLIINENQFDAFALSTAKKKRAGIMEDLMEKGFGELYEKDRNLIVEDSRGNKTIIVFSQEYIPFKIIKPSGIEYGFDIDEEGKLIRLLFPGEDSIEWVYYGDLLKGICINDNITTINYDKENRIGSVVYSDKQSLSFNYNSTGQLHEILNREKGKRKFEILTRETRLVYKNTNTLGRTTEFEIDGSGKIVKLQHPDGDVQLMGWDDNLHAERATLRNGTERIIFYDEGDMKRVEYEDGSFINFANDETNQIRLLENESGTVLYQYDDWHNLIREGFEESHSNFLFDQGDLLSQIEYACGLKVTYQYDEDQRLIYINVNEKKCQLEYATNDTLARIYYPNNLVEHRKYKTLKGLEGIHIQTIWGETTGRQLYEYDELSRLIKYTRYNASAIVQELYIDYDEESHITKCMDIVSENAEIYEYDAGGNMIKDNGRKIRRGHLDQIESVEKQLVQYDTAKNITMFYNENEELVELEFNDAGLLKFAEVDNEQWKYYYDAIGRRVSKTNKIDFYKYYWWDNRLLSEEHSNGCAITLRNYLYAPSDAMPIGFIENGKLYWLHKDMRGAVYSVTDEAGVEVWSAIYDAFGQATVLLSLVKQPWRLMGQYYDEETGLCYHLTRYYSPYLKSYISVNPQWYKTGSSNYSYAINDPFNRVSPTGTSAMALSSATAILDSFLKNFIGGQDGFAYCSLINDRMIPSMIKEHVMQWSDSLKSSDSFNPTVEKGSFKNLVMYFLETQL